MPFRTIRRKLLGYHQLTASQYKDPTLDIPDLNGYEICLKANELTLPVNGKENVFVTEKVLQPYKIGFGNSPSQVIKAIGKPLIRIDNSDMVPGHTVLVFKRMVWAYRSCCQAHFMENKLFLVIDSIKKPFRPGLFIAGSILSALGYGEDLIYVQNNETTCLTDAHKNVMTIEEEIMVTIRVQQANIPHTGDPRSPN